MSDARDGFDAIGVVVDWIDACKERRLDDLLNLYDATATVECCEGGSFRGRSEMERYWRPRLARAVTGAFEIDARCSRKQMARHSIIEDTTACTCGRVSASQARGRLASLPACQLELQRDSKAAAAAVYALASDQLRAPHWHSNMRTVFPVLTSIILRTIIG